MQKTWLVRDTKHLIQGPFSRDTIIEKYKSDQFSEDDELSQGNGYWFWIREKELVQHYLLEGNQQDPAKPFIAEKEIEIDSAKERRSVVSEIEMPIELADETDTDQIVEASEGTSGEVPDDVTRQISRSDLDQQSSNNFSTEIAKEKPPIQIVIENPIQQSTNNYKDNSEKSRKKYQRDDRYLYVIIFLLIALLVGVFYYYKNIINKPINFDDITFQMSPIQDVHAKLQKKNSINYLQTHSK